MNISLRPSGAQIKNASSYPWPLHTTTCFPAMINACVSATTHEIPLTVHAWTCGVGNAWWCGGSRKKKSEKGERDMQSR